MRLLIGRFPPLLLLIGCMASSFEVFTQSAGTSRETAVAKTGILVELFTSEGCSSCPPADQLLRQLDLHTLAKGEQIVVLGEHVDYWDGTGWRDRFSSRDFTDRQAEYARRFNISGPYTPQMVVDGTREFVGNDPRLLQSALNDAASRPKASITISWEEVGATEIIAKIKVAPLPQGAKHVDLYIALADNADETQIGGGENSGKLLKHVAAVRSLDKTARVGLQGIEKEVRFRIPKSVTAQNLRVVAFVQETNNGAVLGAAVKLLAGEVAIR
ncbi:MAG TPA: DUF1223 domain-containing protein [Terriglobales bacterium]|nr:DUF1223 domain-containing protein [Terriglobales bacterium]